MLAKFDPVSRRRRWLNFQLKNETNFAPDELAPRVRPQYVADLVNAFIEAYWLGLANEVRPTLEQIIVWMDSQPEPDQSLFSGKRDHWHNKWHALYSWRQTLGLCKWLSRADCAENEFRAALDIELQAWKQANPEDLVQDHDERQQALSERLAMALAANVPAIGLELYEATAVERPSALQRPLLQFGFWACQHLAYGGNRDAAFIAKGRDMLRASLLPHFFWEAEKIEPGLWLKAIYWDSGAVRTPEQALAKVYDSLPGVERPDFVPR
jgi:hypothetical protein